MGTNLLLYLLVVGAGISVAMQQIINANLRSEIGSPWWAGFISYLVGTIAMLTMILMVKGPRLAEILSARTTPLSWTGGIFGALFIGIVIFMIPGWACHRACAGRRGPNDGEHGHRSLRTVRRHTASGESLAAGGCGAAHRRRDPAQAVIIGLGRGANRGQSGE